MYTYMTSYPEKLPEMSCPLTVVRIVMSLKMINLRTTFTGFLFTQYCTIVHSSQCKYTLGTLNMLTDFTPKTKNCPNTNKSEVRIIEKVW